MYFTSDLRPGLGFPSWLLRYECHVLRVRLSWFLALDVDNVPYIYQYEGTVECTKGRG